MFSKFKINRNIKKYLKSKGGRNNTGRITVNGKGGRQKHMYRFLDWNRSFEEGLITNFEYDPNRSSFIAKVFFKSSNNVQGAFRYILVPKGLKIFDKLISLKYKNKDLLLKNGYYSILFNFEFGDFIHSVEDNPQQGAIFARSAGTFCQVLQNSSADFQRLRLPSGEHRLVSSKASATLGIVSNERHKFEVIGKAGKSRWLNRRPKVRGVAKNPVDHPHGGGQGKTKGGRPSVTPWSRPTKGQPTRNIRRKNTRILKGNKTRLKNK